MFGGGVIRAQLDWSRFRAPGVTVRQSVSRSRETLGCLYTVWYVDGNGQAAEWDDEHARPMRVNEVATADVAWPVGRTRQLAELETLFRRGTAPVQLILPVYVVGQDRLIIDGTHRAVAAYRAAVAVRLMLIEVHGPVDAAVLPDLRHYL